MKKVEVSVEALCTVLNFFTSKNEYPPEKVKAALKEMAGAVNNIPSEMPFTEGFRVKPKTGRNYLRAGSTAYDEAAIVSVEPFIVASLDGMHFWEGMEKELFVVYEKIASPAMDLLRLAYKELKDETA